MITIYYVSVVVVVFNVIAIGVLEICKPCHYLDDDDDDDDYGWISDFFWLVFIS